MEQRQKATYEARFLKAYERLEKPLFRLVVIGLVLIVAAQLTLSTQTGRNLLSQVDQLEGQRTSGVLSAAATKQAPTELTIRAVGTGDALKGLSKVWVKVNGVPVTAFMKQEVSVRVKEHDVVSVDTSQIPGLFRFEVDHDDPHISYPVPGDLVETSEGEAEIGPILFMK